MIKAIIFDFDDTLINRQASAYYTYRAFLKRYFNEEDDPLKFETIVQEAMLWDMRGTTPIKTRASFLIDKYGINEDVARELREFWINEAHKYVIPFEGTKEVLEKLKEKYRLAILTNGSNKLQNNKVDVSGFRDYFELVAVSEEIGANKPDKKAFTYVLEKMDLLPSECIYVGDSIYNDVYGAYNAGIIPIWIYSDPNVPCEYNVRRIQNINELPKVIEEIEQ